LCITAAIALLLLIFARLLGTETKNTSLLCFHQLQLLLVLSIIQKMQVILFYMYTPMKIEVQLCISK
jgi:hypothetical protein